MKRKIIEIDQEKCDGCGLCAEACHERAIAIIDGKAQLVSESYCDGLGDCLPTCPRNAISIVEKEAEPFNELAVRDRIESLKEQGCPGDTCPSLKQHPTKTRVNRSSQLRQWPVQLHLVNPEAPYFQGADLLLAADCTAYAYAAFHEDFITGKVTLIGCPKLDRVDAYLEKLTHILTYNQIKRVTVVRMNVPCCSGLMGLLKKSLEKSGVNITYAEFIIDPEGKVYQERRDDQ